jgi:hypothetical protein
MQNPDVTPSKGERADVTLSPVEGRTIEPSNESNRLAKRKNPDVTLSSAKGHREKG